MHLYELNPGNPCGMKGHMARQYGSLMQEIWGGGVKTVAPLKLRVCLQLFAYLFIFVILFCQELHDLSYFTFLCFSFPVFWGEIIIFLSDYQNDNNYSSLAVDNREI